MPPVYRYSRRASGVLTFGLRGRIAATLVVVVVPMWFFLYAGAFGLLGLIIWPVIALPLLLRDIWRPARVLVASRRDVDFVPPTPAEAPEPGTYVGPKHPGQKRW